MTARAVFRKADLNRAVEVAKEHGYQVVIEGGSIRLLPIAANSPANADDDDARRMREAFSE